MKQFSQQLHKKATTVKLRAAEKRDLRDRLVSYMEYHPLPAEMQQTTKKRQPAKASPTPASEPFTTFSIPFATLFKSSAIAVALVLVAVPVLAERAVPGDTLYAVKVRFNEELRSTLTFDSYQKVEWETERINRRIAEARLLASEGRLTEAVETEVAEAVRNHAENVQREIEVLRSQDADDATIASITLDSTLEAQSTSLKGDEDDTTSMVAANQDTTRPTSLIASAIDESRAEATRSTPTSTLPAYDKLMARVEQNTTRIYELRTTLQNLVSEEKLAEVDRRIADIERSGAEIMEQVSTEDLSARQALIEVLQRTQRLIVYMTELEVSETVDIDSLVPMILTDEEEQAEALRLTTALDERMSRIESLEARVTDEAVLEKVAVASSSLQALIKKMTLSSTEFTTFQKVANEALELANDTLILLERQLVPTAGEATPNPNASSSRGHDQAASSTASSTAAQRASSTPSVDTESARTATSGPAVMGDESSGSASRSSTSPSGSADTADGQPSSTQRNTTSTDIIDSL